MSTFYTGKGDDGKTSFFGCNERSLKSGVRAEALGSLDEANSLIGLCRARVCDDKNTSKLLLRAQEDLFVVQAEIAGSNKKIKQSRVVWLEKEIEKIATDLPEINTFLIAGESELSALFDYARTVARRAERASVRLLEEGGVTLGKPLLAYLNRLSSLLYVLARREALKSGKVERAPKYGA